VSEVKKFRKKPVVIEAMQFLNTDENDLPLVLWIGNGVWLDFENNALEIETLEGTMTAQPGDWIIRGVQGEFYPCKPDIFAATYEEVTNG